MRGKTKALGLALMATLALSAAMASTASAEFTSGSDNTTLTAEAVGHHVFKTATWEVTCEKRIDHGIIGTSQTEITLEPTFENCITFSTLGTFQATVDTNKCHFTYTIHKNVPMHITCKTAGATQIEFTDKILGSFRKCLDIPEQTPTNPSVDFINGTNPLTGKMDLGVESTVSGITYENTGSCGSTHANDMVYEGKVVWTGDDAGGNPVDVTASS